MHLDEFDTKLSARRISRLLKEHFGMEVNVDALTLRKARRLRENVRSKLATIRGGAKFHRSEQDPVYLGLVMLEDALNRWVSESLMEDQEETDEGVADLFKAPLKAVGDKVDAVAKGWNKGQSRVGGNFKLPTRDGSPAPAPKAAKAAAPAPATKSDDTGSKPSRGTHQFKKNIDGQYTDHQGEKVPDDLHKALQAYAKGKGLDEDGDAGGDAGGEAAATGTTDKGSKGQEPKAKKGGMVFGKGVYESANSPVKLLEDEMKKSEAILAAKDLVDRFQDMVEELGKMINEELPALSDTLRGIPDIAGQAQSYIDSVTGTINGALDTIRTSRGNLDNATRSLAGDENASLDTGGEEMPADLGQPAGTDGDLEMGDGFDAEPAATGGAAAPLGRPERAEAGA